MEIRERSENKIIVIGAGGAGNDVISRMADIYTTDVEFIGMDTDKISLYLCKAQKLLQIGKKRPADLGTGAMPKIGERTARESSKEICAILRGADLAFVICGMGGGTGTGAAPVVSDLARDMGIFTVGCVSVPFQFESRARMLNAVNGIESMKENVDILIVISGDKVFRNVDCHTAITIPEISRIMSGMFQQVVQGIRERIKKLEHNNLNPHVIQDVISEIGLADMVSVMKGNAEGMR